MKLLHSEFLNIWGKLDFLFYQCLALATSSTSIEPLSTSHAAISQMKLPALHQQILPEAQRGGPQQYSDSQKTIRPSPSGLHGALQGKSHLCIPFLGIARPQSQFPHSCALSDLYIPRIGPHISCSMIGRSIMEIYKSLTDTWIWKLGLWLPNSFSGNICFPIFGIGSLQCWQSHKWDLSRGQGIKKICSNSKGFVFSLLVGRWWLPVTA